MTSGWAIVCGSITVTLPFTPKATTLEGPVEIEETGTDDGGCVLISKFRLATRFTLEGFVTAVNNSTAMSTYLTPLYAMRGKQVTITSPDSQYSGNWLMGTPVFSRVAEGAVNRYSFTIEFHQGSTHFVYIT